MAKTHTAQRLAEVIEFSAEVNNYNAEDMENIRQAIGKARRDLGPRPVNT